MASDIHRLDNGQYLSGLDDEKFNLLSGIFETYKHWTGITIDPYGDTRLTIENQKTLIRIIDDFVDKTDLNLDRQKTVAILEFRGLLSLCRDHDWALNLIGD